MVSYQSAEVLEDCLEALLAADGIAEIVVVDNGSTDGSPDLVRSLDDPKLRMVEPGYNTGFAGGCNRGFEALSTDLPWVAFVNPDVAVTPECLRVAIDAADGVPDVAGVAPRLMRPDGRTVDSLGQVLNPRTLEVVDRGYGQALEELSLERTDVLAACGALAVYRRAALDQVSEGDGPWAEHFFCFWEDLELGWRLTNRGWRVVSVPEAVAVHGRGAGARRRAKVPCAGGGRPELEACILSNRWMTLIRHLDTPRSGAAAPLLLPWDLGVTLLGLIWSAGPFSRHISDAEWGSCIGNGAAGTFSPQERLAELPW